MRGRGGRGAADEKRAKTVKNSTMECVARGGCGWMAGVGVVALWWTGAALGGELTIADLAPRESIFVAGTDKAGAMIESFNRTGLRAMWDDPATQEWLKGLGSSYLPAVEGALEAVGVKMEDLKAPTGALGIAFWMAGGKEGGASERGVLLGLGDFGESAGAMNEIITAALEKASDRKTISLKEENYQGVILWTIHIEGGDGEKRAGDAEKGALDGEDDDDEGAVGAVGGMFEGFGEKPLCFARAGEYLLVSSEEEALRQAVDRAQGGKGPSVEESEEFAGVRRQLGSAQGYGAVMMKPLLEMVKRNLGQAGGEVSEVGAMLPILDSIGLGEVRAVGGGVRFDGESGMVEAPMAVLAPVKKGLLALVDLSGPFEAPSFIGADAATSMVFRFNFSGLLPLVNQVIAALPAEEGEQAQAMAGMLAMTAGPLLANIGPEVYAVTQYERPFTPESQRQIFALTVKDSGAVATSLAGLQGMLGLESRDFQGNQIWSAGGGMGGAPSIGLGFGRLFIGPTGAVENAMRLAGAGEGARLSGEKRYKESTRPLSTPGMMFGWSDIAKTADWYDWMTKNMEKIVKSRIASAFGPEEPADDEERQWRKEAEEDAMKNIPAWLKSLPTGELLKKHMGDSLMEMRSTKEGFEGRTILLRP